MLNSFLFFQLNQSLEAKREDVARLTTSHAEQKEKHTEMLNEVATAEELLQTLVTGLSSNSNASTAGGYLGQLADAKARLAAASTEEEQARMRMGMVEKEMKDKELKWKAVEKEAGEGAKSLEKGKKDIEALKRKLGATGWSAEKDNDAMTRAREARDAVRTLTEVCHFILCLCIFLMWVRIPRSATRSSRRWGTLNFLTQIPRKISTAPKSRGLSHPSSIYRKDRAPTLLL